MRRMLLVAVLGIAVLLAASVMLIRSWTSAPPSVTSAPPASVAGATAALPGGVPAAVPGGIPPPAGSVPGPVRAVPSPPPERPQVRVLGKNLDRLKVSFKLDPRLTQGLHMGERWVSPATHVATGRGSLVTVAARASGVDAQGRPFKSPTWSPAQPDMVAVSPEQGAQVEITVLRPGESTLTVSGGGATKTLKVKAVEQAGVWQVDISQ